MTMLTVTVFYTWWSNLESWLNSSQGWIIYLIGFVTIATYLILFSNLRSLRKMNRIPAVLIWLGVGLLPVILVIALKGSSAGYDVSYVAFFCTPPIAVLLVVGLLLVAKGRGKKPPEIGKGEAEAE